MQPDAHLRAEACQRLLDEFAAEQDWGTEDQEVEDLFTVVKIMEGRLWLQGHIEPRTYGPIPVPLEVTGMLGLDWSIAGILGLANRRWQFVEVGRVMPA